MLSINLFKIGSIKFGTFTLKSGIISPIYVDLRPIISYPKLLNSIAEELDQLSKKIPYQLLCGVPYTALPITTSLSLKTSSPMLMHRKEEKNYGTKKLIEGVFSPQQRCLVVEDVITSGSSVLKTIHCLKKEKLVINDLLVILDREQGGREFLEKQGYQVHSLLTLSQILQELNSHGLIKRNLMLSVKTFIEENQVNVCYTP
jgi:orotate phosphoribosyltransferase